MNIVLLSPHFPENHYLYALHLRDLGANVIGLADEPWGYMPGHVQQSLNDYVQIQDMNNYDQLLRACGQITAQYGKIDRIESLNEHWLETEAQLRTDFNVPGIHSDGIARIKRKSEMKPVFAAHDIPYIRGQRVQSLEEAQAFVAEVGFPVVLKPDTGVGASQTYKVEDAETLAKLYAHIRVPYIAEEFIEGQIVTFDGLADRTGRPVFFISTIYSQGVMEAVNHNDHIYYYTLREVPADVEALGRKMLKAFEVRERFFHFEFFRRPNGELVALEVNMRPPGGPTLDMFNYANDIDLYREWAYVVMHNHFNSPWSRPYSCMYVGRKQHLDYVYSHEEVLHHWGHLLVRHGQLPVLFRRAMGDYFYIFRSPDEADVIAAAQWIQQQPALVGA